MRVWIITLLILLTQHISYAQSSNFSVSVQVGTTNLILQGYTSPNSYVTFTENSSIVATTSSDIYGYFETSLTSYNITERTIIISSTDTLNRTTAGTSYTVTLVPGTDTTISNIILSPTYSLSKTQLYSASDTIEISGKSVPNSQIDVYIDSIYNAEILANTNGTFIFNLIPTSLSLGNHTISIKSIYGLHESIISQTYNFTIIQRPTSGNNDSDEDQDEEDEDNDHDYKQSNEETEDNVDEGIPSMLDIPILTIPDRGTSEPILDKDIFLDKITIENMSDYVDLWIRYKNMNSLLCDLNSDAICDLIDFSILMYRVGR